MNEANSVIETITSAPERICCKLTFDGMSADEVFDFIGDPDKITDWYLLAESVQHHAAGPDGQKRFNVRFIFFGDVFEEVLYWDPPNRYIYKAQGDDFPIKDYVAELLVEMTGAKSGIVTWSIRCNEIEGEANRRVLPVILPALNEASLKSLATALNGEFLSIETNFEGLKW